MTEDQYLHLCKAYLQGKCSKEEENLLITYQEENGMYNLDLSIHNNSRIRESIRSKIEESKKLKNRSFNLRIINWKVAASVAALIILTTYFFNRYTNGLNQTTLTVATKKKSIKASDITPGSAKAILTLSDGQSIELSSAKNGLISTKDNASISKSGNGISVSSKDKDSKINSGSLNTISIPRGGKFDIVLPDGTHVWLNSSSSLRFPVAFASNERRVILEGEAYFEVTKNINKPFKVDVAGKQLIEVLGTHFNVTAFNNEDHIETTLLEGSVKINSQKSAIKIIPGQMAYNNLQGGLKVVSADLDEVMAWKNDMFIFKNENITSIMKKISRWYDVDVDFKGDMSAINFEGNYSRSKSLNSLLKNIELTDKVRFKIDERRITVTAK
ncbi:FecR family protein [Pedobacter mucosus]|uniref:FecR family protein n=1 Tax=Pedobacter mucosus TaxID=2895286 RepID=UPI001EE3EE6A|nr:FecR family protein [Pedobacter mucosus]UKT64958.1 FecR domain-containing protein [Pedobacter mucosus]